ncbi:hypothetical protein [Micromonospora zhanjiangensis]|uniref:Uncharacterized protein n=1 Tax=Micromonospora zhanjiangensis TaxID=1522057 RepID=A0ABV8KUW1_9ACTN
MRIRQVRTLWRRWRHERRERIADQVWQAGLTREEERIRQQVVAALEEHERTRRCRDAS